MRIALFLLAVLVAVWAWRSSRAGKALPKSRDAKQLQPQEDMSQCALCGLHFPMQEGISGKRNLAYCSAEHRDRADA